MLDKSAPTTHDIHPLLRSRWSPRAFTPAPIPPADVLRLLEAARWTPSAVNEQPWNFLVISREDSEAFNLALSCLAESNAVWAQHASLLILSVARLRMTRDGSENPVALYDLGQAVAHLTVQAAAQNLWVHQMGGFSKERAREVFEIPEDHAPVTFIAVGQLGDPEALPERLRERELAPRERKPLDTFVFGGHWGQSSPLLEPSK
jgi:nitroreductase